MALRFLRNKPPSRAAWYDDEFVQPTFQVAVEEGNTFRRGEANEFVHTGIADNAPRLTAGRKFRAVRSDHQ